MKMQKIMKINSEIWDSHVHLFPPEIYKHWEQYAKRDAWFANLTRIGEAWADVDAALACADEAGITGLVMQGWYWNDAGLERMHNDYMTECIRRHSDRLKAFVAINPLFDGAVAEIERCVKNGFVGVGELGPGGNGYDFKNKKLWDVLECAQALDVPVCIHCGEPVGRIYKGKDLTSLQPIPDILKQFPDLKLILAHMGGGLPFYEMLRGMTPLFKNVWYDTAANPLLYDIRSIRQVMQLVGEHRLLFGSDFPLLLYPGKCKHMDMQIFVTDIQNNAQLSPNQTMKFMGKNLLDLLKKS